MKVLWFGKNEVEATFAAVPFTEVLSSELDLVHQKRKNSPRSPGTGSQDAPFLDALNSDLVGLGLSGGGIRSATFNLGVLQALAHLKILPEIDYLSTVSGGGYIGSFLMSWIRRRGIKEVGDELDPMRRKDSPSNEAKEVQFLRDYSNYLTPRRGLFGLDFWTMVATYLRNFSLNFTILTLSLLGVLLIPRFGVHLYSFAQNLEGLGSFGIVLSFVLLTFAISIIVKNLSSVTGIRIDVARPKEYSANAPAFILLLIMLSAVSMNLWNWQMQHNPLGPGYSWAMWGIVFYAFHWILGSLFGTAFTPTPAQAPESGSGNSFSALNNIHKKLKNVSQNVVSGYKDVVRTPKLYDARTIILSSIVAGAVGGILAMYESQLANVFSHFSGRQAGGVIFGVPLIILVLLLTGTLHLGLAGRGFSEEAREWWGRLGACLILINLAFSGLAAMFIFGGDAFTWMISSGSEKAISWFNGSIISGWVLTTLAGVMLGKSTHTGGNKGSQKTFDFVAKLAPIVFVTGLFFLLQWTLDQFPSFIVDERETVSSLVVDLIWIGVLFGLALTLSNRVGVNDFSMSAFYRNRLVRCYLGATNPDRNPHPFTGFDPEDDSPALTAYGLRDRVGPIPIINATLNLVQGKKLAWQQRKASSFFFTPLYSGYQPPVASRTDPARQPINENGFRRTEWFGRSLTMGNVIAISGAAASPNMGYHTSAPLAFLMTIFNVRLGSWLVNTRYHDGTPRKRLGPATGLFYLFLELLGRTNDERKYVYLSDGGHFENLGIYELVRRRCKLIVAVDAGEDRSMTFGDLGNAIEKCRVDLGVDITLNVESIRPIDGTKLSSTHCAVGTIRYPESSSVDSEGVIIYLKSSLTGDEPTDVQRYKSQNDEFPHQSTADQFFDEAQFESYRMLGYHIATQAFPNASGGLAKWIINKTNPTPVFSTQ